MQGGPALRRGHRLPGIGRAGLAVPRAHGISSTPGFGGRSADGIDVVLRLYDKACSDGMSDESYPATITLEVGDKTYSGCGRYLDAK